jgi:hypothetical protein
LILSPLGVLLISITRLLIVSNYNVTTALTVASSGGYFNTLLGTLIPVAPIFMPYLALALLFLDRLVLGLLALFAAIFTSATSIDRPVALEIVRKDGHLLSHSSAAGWFSILIALAIIFLALAPTSEVPRTASIIVGLALIPLVLTLYPFPLHSSFYSDQLQEPWLPTETTGLASHERVIGYVLSRNNGWFTVLMANSRAIDYIPAAQVKSQQICQSVPPGRPIVTLISEPAAIPICPNSGP